MRRVSAKVFGDPRSILSSAASPAVLDDLKFVAKTFGELQKKRHEADYDYYGKLDQNIDKPVGHTSPLDEKDYILTLESFASETTGRSCLCSERRVSSTRRKTR